MTPDRLTYTVHEAAHALGISTRLVYKLAAAGELPSLRLGQRVLIPAKALDAMVQRAAEVA